jgi:hypothetical protein
MSFTNQTQMNKLPFQNLDAVSALTGISDKAAATCSGGINKPNPSGLMSPWDVATKLGDRIKNHAIDGGLGFSEGFGYELEKKDTTAYNVGFRGGQLAQAYTAAKGVGWLKKVKNFFGE